MTCIPGQSSELPQNPACDIMTVRRCLTVAGVEMNGVVQHDGTLGGEGTLVSPLTVLGAFGGDAIFSSVNFPFTTAVGIPAGVNNDFDPGWGIAPVVSTALRVGCGVGGSTITGLVPHPQGRGTLAWIGNSHPGYPLTIAHDSAGSIAANRVICPGGTDFIVPAAGGCLLQCLNAVPHAWEILETNAFAVSTTQNAIAGRIAIGPVGTVNDVIQNGVITPPGLAAGQNDNWQPAGFLAAGRIRVVPGFLTTLTGMAGYAEGVRAGDVKVLQVFGSMTFKHQDAASDPLRRFYLPGAVDLVITTVGAVTFIYDNNAYWWPIGVSQ